MAQDLEEGREAADVQEQPPAVTMGHGVPECHKMQETMHLPAQDNEMYQRPPGQCGSVG